MSLLDHCSPSVPFTPLIIKDSVFDFDVSSYLGEPDDNNTLTPLLRRITATPKLLTPSSILLSPAFSFSPANISRPTTPKRITVSPTLLTPKSILLSPKISSFPANISKPTTPTIVNGRLAPPQQQHCSKSPQRRGSPLAPLLRLTISSPENISRPTTPTFINGRLAPLQQQHYSKTPQRRGSPLAGLRRLRSPRTTSPHPCNLCTRLEVPTQCNYVAGNNNKGCNSKVEASKCDFKSSDLAGRRRCRKLRLKELQRRYAKPFEIHAVPMPLSPRVGYLLRRVGMISYRSLFQMEEVDFVVFRTLTQNDLQVLGIGNVEDREEIYKAVLMADLLVLERF